MEILGKTLGILHLFRGSLMTIVSIHFVNSQIDNSDQLLLTECFKPMAQHWGCVLRIHPSAGHDLALDDGMWLAQKVQEWIINLP
jgi:hypothetical protein